MSDFAPQDPPEPTDRELGLTAPISPSELMRELLLEELNPDLVPGGVIVGPVFDASIQAGCISLLDAGSSQVELYAPVVNVRTQFRCLAPTLEQVDRMARGLVEVLHQRNRTIVLQPSTENSYLIHSINVSAGPSNHRDSDENFESLLFTESKIGLDPVSGPSISYP